MGKRYDMQKIELPNSFILSADWHLRSTVPSCVEASQEEWISIQESAVDKVVDIAIEKKSPVFVVGDIFHSDVTTSFQMIQIIQNAAKRLGEHGLSLYVLFGNHDLKYHTSTNIIKSPLGVLMNSVNVYLLSTFENVSAANFDEEDKNCEYVFKHTLTIPKSDIPVDVINCETPESLLEKFDKAKMVMTGDYHRNFHFEKDGRHVINPGCLTKQAADFENYQNGIYYINLEYNIIEWCPVNIEQKFNHNGYEKKALDQTIENFVEGIKAEDVTLDYVSSLRNESKNHDKGIQNRINNWIEQSGN